MDGRVDRRQDRHRGAWFALAVMALIALWDATRPGAAHAETSARTLADIRQELSGLYALVRGLQDEVKPTATGTSRPIDPTGTTQERLDAIEARLEQLTSGTEELQHRIDQVVADGDQPDRRSELPAVRAGDGVRHLEAGKDADAGRQGWRRRGDCGGAASACGARGHRPRGGRAGGFRQGQGDL